MNAQEYSHLAREHLQKHRPKMFRDLSKRGQLASYLQKLGADAASLESEMERQYLEKNPPPQDYQGRLNSLAQAKQVAQEITLQELVLLPSEADDAAIKRGHYAV